MKIPSFFPKSIPHHKHSLLIYFSFTSSLLSAKTYHIFGLIITLHFRKSIPRHTQTFSFYIHFSFTFSLLLAKTYHIFALIITLHFPKPIPKSIQNVLVPFLPSPPPHTHIQTHTHTHRYRHGGE